MLKISREDPRPAQALLLVTLLYVAGSGVVAFANRYNLRDAALVLADLVYFICGLLAIQRDRLSSIVGSAGRSAVVAALSLGGLCGTTASSLLLWYISGESNFQSQAISWREVVHPVISAPLGEEILFTGLLFASLRTRIRLLYAVVAVAALFSLAHLPPNGISFGVRFVYMFASCLLFERFHSLPLNVGMHVLTNAIPLIVGHLPQVYLRVLPDFAYCLPGIAATSSVVVMILGLKIGGHLGRVAVSPQGTGRT